MSQQIVGAVLESSQQHLPWATIMGCAAQVLPTDDGMPLMQFFREKIADAQ